MLYSDAKDVKWNGIESILSLTMYKFSSNFIYIYYICLWVCVHAYACVILTQTILLRISPIVEHIEAHVLLFPVNQHTHKFHILVRRNSQWTP